MNRHTVLLTDCLSRPGPEIARRLAETGATVLLNSPVDVPELGDLLQEITESGGRAIACTIDSRDREGFDVVRDFVESMAGPLTGVVIQPGGGLPAYAESEAVRDTVEWCRLVMSAEGETK